MSEGKPIELAFSDKYDRDHSQQYLDKHRSGLSRRLSSWRDMQLARRALKDAGAKRAMLLPVGGSLALVLLLGVVVRFLGRRDI